MVHTNNIPWTVESLDTREVIQDVHDTHPISVRQIFIQILLLLLLLNLKINRTNRTTWTKPVLPRLTAVLDKKITWTIMDQIGVYCSTGLRQYGVGRVLGELL